MFKQRAVAALKKVASPSGAEVSLLEAVAVCLSNLNLGERRSELQKESMDILLGMHKVQLALLLFRFVLIFFQKQSEELHFTVGESLSVIAHGWNSSASGDPLAPKRHSSSPQIASARTEVTEEPMKTLMQSVLNVRRPCLCYLFLPFQDYLFSDRPETRAPAALWLLSIVKHAGSHPVLQRNLAPIQRAFSALLSDSAFFLILLLFLLFSPFVTFFFSRC